MKFNSKDKKQPLPATELLAVLCPEGTAPELPKGVEVPRTALSDFKGEFREMRGTDASAGKAKRVLFVGLGKAKDLDLERLRRGAALCVNGASRAKVRAVSIWVPDEVEEAAGGAEAAGRAVGEAAVMAAYTFDRFKGKKKGERSGGERNGREGKPSLRSVTAHGSGAPFRRGARKGRVLGEANTFVRDLQNAPGNHMRPRDLVAAARKLAQGTERIRFKSFDERAMERMGMGSLLSVSRGSEEPAYLIHLVYRPKRRAKGRVAVVGKGLTFDAGGISLKPAAKMDEMKYDMSGGAAVLGLFKALRDLDVPLEVHGIVGTSENLPDGRANKPGDVVKAMNGTTIEVLNTDAEGRLVLADALSYAVERVKPDTIVDLATLTGAVVHALGHELSGLFATSDRLRDELVEAGRTTGELCWPLPLMDVHKDQMKSKVADLRNINSGEGNGSTAGAAFLSNFVGDTEWAHLDIAGTAWGSVDRDYVGGPQGSGVGVRLLAEWLDRRGG